MEKKDNILKQAIERRANSSLPSNFNYRMMNRVRIEAVKRYRLRKTIGWCCLISGSLFLLGLGIYALVACLDVSLTEYIPQAEGCKPSADLIAFCWYIAALVWILLGLDHWMRRHRRKAMDK